MNIVVLSSIVAVCMAVGAMFIRLKAAKKPATLKKLYFHHFYEHGGIDVCFPEFRLTPAEMLEAIGVGLFFSIFLIKTSKFEIRGQEIYLKRSKAFVLF